MALFRADQYSLNLYGHPADTYPLAQLHFLLWRQPLVNVKLQLMWTKLQRNKDFVQLQLWGHQWYRFDAEVLRIEALARATALFLCRARLNYWQLPEGPVQPA